MEFNRKKISDYIMIATIIGVVAWFNIYYFRNRISSNNQSISEYNLSDDDIAPAGDMATVVFFYPADIYQTDQDADGYIEHKFSPAKNRPKIIIEPHYGHRRSGAVAAESYKRLQPLKEKYDNIILLGPSHRKFSGAAIPKSAYIKTPLGSIDVNQKIIAELQKNPLFKDNSQYYTLNNSINVQLPFIKKTFDDIKVVPILYGQISPSKLADTLKPYLHSSKNLLIVVADISDYFSNNLIDNDNNSAKLQQHYNCGKEGIETTLSLAKEFGVVPQLLDINSENVSSGVKLLAKSWSYDEPQEQVVLQGIDLYQQHLHNFVHHHHKELLQVAKNSILAGKEKRFRPKRKHFNNFLFNRGSSYIKLYQNDKLIGSSGNIIPTRAIADDIAANIFLILQNANEASNSNNSTFAIKLSLLTDLEAISFSSYEDLLSQIIQDVDGLLLISGKREGFLRPEEWLNVSDKDEFLTKLKIKAGLSPTYWSDNIKIFRFREVEVKDDKD